MTKRLAVLLLVVLLLCLALVFHVPSRARADLTGRVVMPDGAPADSVLIEARAESAESWERHVVEKVGPDGEFRIPGLLVGWEYELLASTLPSVEETARLVAVGLAKGGTTDVVLQLQEGGSVRGRFVNGAGGSLPPTRVCLRATRRPNRSELDRRVVERTVDDGEWSLSGFLPGRWTIVLENGLFAEPLVVEVPTLGHEAAVGQWPVFRAASVGGRLVGVDGSPVVEALVDAEPWEFDSLFHHEPPWVDGRSDAQGRFQLRGVAPGGVILNHEGLRRHLQLKPGEVRDLGDVPVAPIGFVSGRFVTANGEPLGGEQVYVFERRNMSSLVDVPYRVETDSEGRFTLGLKAGRYGWFAQGGARHTVRVVAGETTEIELRQSVPHEPRVARVHATSKEGEPAGLDLYVEPRGNLSQGAVRGLTFRGGLYESAVHAEEHVLTVMDEGVLLSRHDLRIGTGPFELVLPAGEVRVELAGGQGVDTDLQPVWIEPENWLDPLPFGQRYAEADRAVFRFLPDGRYRVVAGSSEEAWDEPFEDLLATRTALVEVVNGGSSIVQLQMRRTSGLTGTVRLEDGSPVLGARIRLWTSDKQPLDLPDLRADARGRFTTWNLPDTAGWVSATSALAASAAPIELRDLEPGRLREIELVLAPASSVSVRLEDSGGAVGSLVRALDAGGFPFRPYESRCAIFREDVDDVWSPRFLDVFEWEFGALPPGTYRFQAKTLDGRSVERELEIGGAEQELHTLRLP